MEEGRKTETPYSRSPLGIRGPSSLSGDRGTRGTVLRTRRVSDPPPVTERKWQGQPRDRKWQGHPRTGSGKVSLGTGSGKVSLEPMLNSQGMFFSRNG